MIKWALPMALLLMFGCASNKDELGFEPLMADESGGDDRAAKASAARENWPKTSDDRFGFVWTLSDYWEFRDAVQSLPALAQFEGGAAVAVRKDRRAQALLLVVDLPSNAEAEPDNLGNLEKFARKKSVEQKVAIEELGSVTVDGHEAIVLIGRQGDKHSARMHMWFLHAGNRRFELQCRRTGDAPHVCNATFDQLKIQTRP